MPRQLLMGTIVTRCQQRCDLEGSGHIANSEWKALISEQYGDLYSVVAETGLRYFESTNTITTTGATSYTAPTDHLGTVLVSRVLDSAGRRRDLVEIQAQERAGWIGISGEAFAYELVGTALILHPTPPSGQTYEILYIPQSPDLSATLDGTNVDLVTPDGEAFLIWGVAVKALAKSESDVQLAIAEREAARARLAEWATLRAFNQPRRRMVVDNSEWLEGGVDAADWRYR